MIKDFHMLDHDHFMQEALREAEEAGKRGDRPIGAVIVHNGKFYQEAQTEFIQWIMK